MCKKHLAMRPLIASTFKICALIIPSQCAVCYQTTGTNQTSLYMLLRTAGQRYAVTRPCHHGMPLSQRTG